MRPLLIVFPLSFLLTCCSSSPEATVAVYKREIVTPPENLLDYCESGESDRTFGGELNRLAGLIRCERADKDAIRAWIDEVHAEDVDGSRPSP